MIRVLAFVAAFVVFAGASVWFVLDRPSAASQGFGPDALAMDCSFDSYCRAEDCSGALPETVRIVLNGPYGRTYMNWDRPLGQATVLTQDTATTYAGQPEEAIFAVFAVAPDRSFTFRMTERQIDAEGFETGAGRCTPPAPIPEAA